MKDIEKINLACKNLKVNVTDLDEMSNFVLDSNNRVISFTKNGKTFSVGDTCYYASMGKKYFFILEGLRIMNFVKLQFMVSGTYISQQNYKSESICYSNSLLKDEFFYSII